MLTPRNAVLSCAVGAAVLAAGCGRTFRASVTQPNPLVHPLETLRQSEAVVIVTGDMELNVPQNGGGSGGSIWVDQHYPLTNVAAFTVVSRDRLRFHVQVMHKWEDWVDLGDWKAYLTDDQGHRYQPEEVDPSEAHHIVKVWDYETRSTVNDPTTGDVIAVRNDGWKRRNTLGSLSVFQGQGDFVFHHHEIFNPSIKRLTLHISHKGTAFDFTWRFADRVAMNQPQ